MIVDTINDRIGMGAVIAALRIAGAYITPWHPVPGMALGGLGMGLVAPTLTDFALAGVPESEAGAASGVLNTIFQVGAAVGVAAIGAVFFGTSLASTPRPRRSPSTAPRPNVHCGARSLCSR